jgi:hypothetical protein
MQEPILTKLTCAKRPKFSVELYDLANNLKGMQQYSDDGAKTPTTLLHLASGQTIYVRESPDEIKKLIGWEIKSKESSII